MGLVGPHRPATLFPLTALLGTDRVRKGDITGGVLSDTEARVGLFGKLPRSLPAPILGRIWTASSVFCREQIQMDSQPCSNLWRLYGICAQWAKPSRAVLRLSSCGVGWERGAAEKNGRKQARGTSTRQPIHSAPPRCCRRAMSANPLRTSCQFQLFQFQVLSLSPCARC